MAAEAEQKSPPFLVLIILAMFGLYTIPKGTFPASSTSNASARPVAGPHEAESAVTSKPPTDEIEDADIRTLKPLLDFLDDGGTTGGPKSVGAVTRLLDAQSASLRCLIATIPDPDNTSNDYRFDEFTKAIQRAIETTSKVLVRFNLPPPPPAPDKPNEHPDGNGLLQGLVRLIESRNEPKTPSSSTERLPGLFLFQGVERQPVTGSDLLLVFLVPENPSWGIEKSAMNRSLRLAVKLDEVNRQAFPVVPKIWPATYRLNILGPHFSGSQHSLEQALKGFLEQARGMSDSTPCSFQVIGTASAIDPGSLERAVKPCHELSFHATVHRTEAIMGAMINFIQERQRPNHIALLIESDTGFGDRQLGQAFEAPKPETALRDEAAEQSAKIIRYPFPSHLAILRDEYEKKGYLGSSDRHIMITPDRLPIPLGRAEQPRDLATMQTLAFTAVTSETILDQILSDIAHHDEIDAVGIVATDALDIIFLARQVRLFCPDVQIFTSSSDLLFSHSQDIAYLRGMLVGSTYPLYPHNQTWSYSYQQNQTHLFFSSDGAEAAYNATLAHLHNMSQDQDGAYPLRLLRFLERGSSELVRLASTPPGPLRLLRFLDYGSGELVRLTSTPRRLLGLLDYGFPLDNPLEEVPMLPKMIERMPPIWISTVGNRSLFPLAVVNPKHYEPPKLKDSGGKTRINHYIYKYKQSSNKLTISLSDAKELFRPSFNNLWNLLFTISSLACVFMTYVTFLNQQWTYQYARTKQSSTEKSWQLAKLLNWTHSAEIAARNATPGPGLLVATANLLLLVVYWNLTWPILTAVGQPDQSWLGFPDVDFESALIIVACLSICSLGTSFLVALATAIRFWKDGSIPSRTRFHTIWKLATPATNIIWFSIYKISLRQKLYYLHFVFHKFPKFMKRRFMPIAPAAVHAERPWLRVFHTRQHRWRHAVSLAIRMNMGRQRKWRDALSLAIRKDMGRRRLRRRVELWVISLLVTIPAFLLVCGVLWFVEDRAEDVFRFERMIILSSGVSPTLPILFIGMSGFAWIYASLTRQSMLEEFHLEPSDSNRDASDGSVIGSILKKCRRQRDKVDEILRASLFRYLRRLPRGVHGFWSLSILTFDALFLWRVYCKRVPAPEHAIFTIPFLVLFFLFYMGISLSMLRLMELWTEIRKMLRLLARLPVIRAIDRIPQPLSRWFFDASTTRDSQVDMVRRQAEALAAASTPEVRAMLNRATTLSITDAEWHQLKKDLKGDKSDSVKITQKVLKILVPIWTDLPLADSLAPSPSATATPSIQPGHKLDRWVMPAEELIALQIMRWLAPMLLQIWTLIGFLVVASMSLLFAVTSYPFPVQGWGVLGVTVLIGILVVQIVIVILGVNRDELISRVSNTPANRLSLDGPLLANLVTYIVPLLFGIVTFLSFDVGDFLRAVFGPIARGLPI